MIATIVAVLVGVNRLRRENEQLRNECNDLLEKLLRATRPGIRLPGKEA